MTDDSRPPLPAPLRVPVYDSHCHLDIGVEGRDGDAGGLSVAEALVRARTVGVQGIVQIGCDLPSARWSVELAATTPDVLAGVALHPNEVPRLAERDRWVLEEAWTEIDRLAGHPRVRAVGETGLDHFRTGPEGRAVQEESFRRHIAMSKAHGKALVIHDRDAHEDVVRALDSEGAPEIVVFHCFSGGVDLARVCAERGWYASFAGTVTFRNAQDLRDALLVLPVDRLLVETDAPFLAPTPHRGRPNASYLVPLTVRAMAEVRGQDVDELCTAIASSSRRVFGDFTLQGEPST